MAITGNEIRYEKAKQAVQDLFDDQSVAIEETIANLDALIGEIEIMLDALKSN